MRQQKNGKSSLSGEAFWRFSLAFYARPGMADALIALQDRAGLDVNLMLFALWRGALHGQRLHASEMRAAEAPVAETPPSLDSEATVIQPGDKSRIETPTTAAIAVNAPGSAVRILLADDSPDNRMLIRAYLKNSRYLTDEVEDGQLAFERFKTRKYDVVLLDIQMPMLDGYGAVADPSRMSICFSSPRSATRSRPLSTWTGVMSMPVM